jgi:hypothetical protein
MPRLAGESRQQWIYRIAREHGWWDDIPTDPGAAWEAKLARLPGALLLVTSEVAEAAEELRDPSRSILTTYVKDGSPKPEGFGIELADAAIRLYDTCAAIGLDLDALIDEKCLYNETRPYRHGGKRF